MTPPTPTRRLPLALLAPAVAWLAMLGTLLLGTVVLALAGWSPLVVSSGSMAPTIAAGDLVLVGGASAPELGSVVLVTDPSLSQGSYLHRLVGIDGALLVTQGDANADPDPPVAADRVAGQVRAVVPSLGLPLVWLRTGAWLPLGLVGLATWAALTAVLSPSPASRAGRALPTRWRRRPAAIAGIAAVTVSLGALGATEAAFTATTGNGPSTVQAAIWRSYATVVAADSPSYWWRLNETFGTSAAAAAGGQAGTYVNSPSLNQPGAIVNDTNRSVGFAGGTASPRQRITFGTTAAAFANRSPFTLEAWVYLTGLSDQWPRVLSREFGGGAQGGWAMGINGTTSGSAYQPFCSRRDAAGGGDWVTAAPITANAWHHLVCTYDGTTMSFYIDGAVQQTGASTRAIPTGSTTLAVGGFEWSDFVQGRIDEPAIYSTALTPQRVRAHYLAGLAGV